MSLIKYQFFCIRYNSPINYEQLIVGEGGTRRRALNEQQKMASKPWLPPIMLHLVS